MTPPDESAPGDDVSTEPDRAVDDTPDDDAIGRPAMEGGDRERGDRGTGADEAGRRSHELSQGEFGPTADYGDG